MFLVAMLGAGALGVVIERFAYRPLRNSPRLTVLITALGVSFFLQNSMLLLFGAQFRSYQSFQLGSDNPPRSSPVRSWSPSSRSRASTSSGSRSPCWRRASR